MNAGHLLAQFDRVVATPDAAPRLRRFILDLAIRGKLVEQDPADEPACEQLKRIDAEKTRLLKSGIIRKQGALPVIGEQDYPFAIPTSWRWVQLARLGLVNPRNQATDEAEASFAPMATISAEYGATNRYETRRWCEIKNGFTHFAEGDVALAKITPCFQNGKSTVFRDLIGGIGAGTTELHVIRPIEVNPEYILVFLKSPHFIDSGIPRMTGTAGQKRVPSEYFMKAAFPLPPLAEQHRIVAKVDELMALCDLLEAAQAERERGRDRLVASSLARLTAGATDGGFCDHARFHLHYLHRLTTRPEHIKQLRQAILNLAVRGKLVPQDPSDEPASALLERVTTEKTRLAKKGTLKKDKSLWDGSLQEPPHVLPDSWRWVRIQDVFEVSRGGSPRPAGDPQYFGGNIPWITVREITKDEGKYLTSTATGLTEAGSQRSRFIDPGDLLLTNSGATLGVPKISAIRGCMNDGVAVLRLFHKVPLNDFAYTYLHSQTAAFRSVNQGMGQPNLNTQMIAGWFLPLPPLAEQQRIVAKVEELMALCDRLQAGLADAEAEGRRLLDALLHEALAPAAMSHLTVAKRWRR